MLHTKLEGVAFISLKGFLLLLYCLESIYTPVKSPNDETESKFKGLSNSATFFLKK